MLMEHRGGLKPWTSHAPLIVLREDIDSEEPMRDKDFETLSVEEPYQKAVML
jgi:hypothetical protein